MLRYERFQSFFTDKLTEEETMVIIFPSIKNDLGGLQVVGRCFQPVSDLLFRTHLARYIVKSELKINLAAKTPPYRRITPPAEVPPFARNEFIRRDFI